ncbi:MAG TPA: DUF2510 domain-containing protein [Acidimicrobiales bacterium]|nr:DUF2510 domain-containing protein [Acidimicrobiales bacterium]
MSVLLVALSLSLLAVLSALVTHQLAENNLLEHGYTPWQLPPRVWGAIGFIAPVVGVGAVLVARDTTRLPTTMPVWMTSPPAWFPDPSGRHAWRFWDGTRWTEQISTDGVTGGTDRVDVH